MTGRDHYDGCASLACVIAPTPFLAKVLVAITEAGILALHARGDGLQLRDSAGLRTGFPHCRPGFRASGNLRGTLLFGC